VAAAGVEVYRIDCVKNNRAVNFLFKGTFRTVLRVRITRGGGGGGVVRSHHILAGVRSGVDLSK
jgi:hypothetical protein